MGALDRPLFPRTVNHGAVAATARPPGAEPVVWVGSVLPDNLANGDMWLDSSATSTLLVPPAFIIPQASLITSSGDTAWPAQYATLFHYFTLMVGGTYRYIRQRIGTASGNIQVGVVALSGSGLTTYTSVKDSGIITAASIGTGVKTIDLGAFTLDAGHYALFEWADNTTITMPHGIITNGDVAPVSATVTLTSAGVSTGSLSWGSTRRLQGLSLMGNL